MAKKFIKRLTDEQIKEFLTQYCSEESMNYNIAINDETSLLKDHIYMYIEEIQNRHLNFMIFRHQTFIKKKVGINICIKFLVKNTSKHFYSIMRVCFINQPKKLCKFCRAFFE